MRRFLLIVFLSPTILLATPRLQAGGALSTAEITGTFTGQGGSNFDILVAGKNKLQVSFSGVYFYKTPEGDSMSNTGQAAGIADLQGDTAYLRPNGVEKTCTLVLRFPRPGQILASQQGDSANCGFGENVRADGSYRKTSSVKPVIY